MVEGLNNLQTIWEKNKGFSEHQYMRELAARQIYHMVGAPTFRNLKMMIRKTIIIYQSQLKILI